MFPPPNKVCTESSWSPQSGSDNPLKRAGQDGTWLERTTTLLRLQICCTINSSKQQNNNNNTRTLPLRNSSQFHGGLKSLPFPYTVNSLTLEADWRLPVCNTLLFSSEIALQRFPDKTATREKKNMTLTWTVLYITSMLQKRQWVAWGRIQSGSESAALTFSGHFFLYCSTWTNELITPWMTVWFGFSPQRSLQNMQKWMKRSLFFVEMPLNWQSSSISL